MFPALASLTGGGGLSANGGPSQASAANSWGGSDWTVSTGQSTAGGLDSGLLILLGVLGVVWALKR